DAHNPFATREQVVDIGLDVVFRTDGLERLVDGFVGATVQGPLERADSGRDSRVHVAERGSGDHRGERRRVHLVLGVENHRDVEHALCEVARLLAGEHVEEVRGVAEVVTRGDGFVAAAEPVVRGEDGGHLGGEAGGRLLQLRVRKVARLRVLGAEQLDGDFERAHRPDFGPDFAEDALDEVVEAAFGVELRLEFVELLLVREALIPEEVGNLFEGGVLGQVVDVVARVNQLAFQPIDSAELGGGYVYSLEPSGDFGHSVLTSRKLTPVHGRRVYTVTYVPRILASAWPMPNPPPPGGSSPECCRPSMRAPGASRRSP